MLRRLIGLLIVVGIIAGIGRMFWGAMHPSTTPEGDRQDVTVAAPPSPYSTEGGHDPNRTPGSTRDELVFRGVNPDTKKFQ